MASRSASSTTWPAFARRVVECIARHEDPLRAVEPPGATRPHGGVFVTLYEFGRLRGCMGTLDPALPLGEAVRRAAVCAAAEDPRFAPVTASELPDLEIQVSILSDPHPMRNLEDLLIGKHGIIVRRGSQRGLFLPQVAVEHHLDKQTFLARCCAEKAGLPPDAWQDPATEVLLFTAEVLREETP